MQVVCGRSRPTGKGACAAGASDRSGASRALQGRAETVGSRWQPIEQRDGVWCCGWCGSPFLVLADLDHCCTPGCPDPEEPEAPNEGPVEEG